MDHLDHAQALEERERDAAIERHRNRVTAPAATRTGRNCVDCDEPIPSKRLAAHPQAIRCIDHARADEARLKHFRKD